MQDCEFHIWDDVYASWWSSRSRLGGLLQITYFFPRFFFHSVGGRLQKKISSREIVVFDEKRYTRNISVILCCTYIHILVYMYIIIYTCSLFLFSPLGQYPIKKNQNLNIPRRLSIVSKTNTAHGGL